MSDDFEPRFEGMSFSHNIDGHGWPDSVTVSNGKDIFDGYSSREYVPYEEVRELIQKAKPMKPVQKAAGRNVCPNCMRSTAREVSPRYCSICGQRLDWSEDNE